MAASDHLSKQQFPVEAAKGESSLDGLAQRGYNTEGWSRWQQGDCGTYAHALTQMKPSLRFGAVADEEGAESHFFAHDDTHAYDSAGKHPLPYTGVHHPAGYQSYLDIDREDYGEPQGDKQEIAEAQAHATQHGILEGRYNAGLR